MADDVIGAGNSTLLDKLVYQLRKSTGRLPKTWPYQEIGHHNLRTYEVVQYPGDPPAWIRIGNYNSITGQLFPGGIHRRDWVSNFAFRGSLKLPGAYADGNPASNGDIVIGNDTWIGFQSIIMSGVTIGDGAVVGARAVVTRDVRPFAVVVGSPAREVSRRFPDEICDRLLEIAWWNWPHEEVLSVVDLLNGGSVEELLSYAASRPSG